MNYPSSHKEFLAIKKTILHFKLYLNHVKFIMKIDLTILAGILKNNSFLTDNNTHVQKWVVFLQNFYFDIVH